MDTASLARTKVFSTQIIIHKFSTPRFEMINYSSTVTSNVRHFWPSNTKNISYNATNTIEKRIENRKSRRGSRTTIRGRDAEPDQNLVAPATRFRFRLHLGSGKENFFERYKRSGYLRFVRSRSLMSLCHSCSSKKQSGSLAPAQHPWYKDKPEKGKSCDLALNWHWYSRFSGFT